MSQSSPREEADRCGKESNQHNGNTGWLWGHKGVDY